MQWDHLLRVQALCACVHSGQEGLRRKEKTGNRIWQTDRQPDRQSGLARPGREGRAAWPGQPGPGWLGRAVLGVQARFVMVSRDREVILRVGQVGGGRDKVSDDVRVTYVDVDVLGKDDRSWGRGGAAVHPPVDGGVHFSAAAPPAPAGGPRSSTRPAREGGGRVKDPPLTLKEQRTVLGTGDLRGCSS